MFCDHSNRKTSFIHQRLPVMSEANHSAIKGNVFCQRTNANGLSVVKMQKAWRINAKPKEFCQFIMKSRKVFLPPKAVKFTGCPGEYDHYVSFCPIIQWKCIFTVDVHTSTQLDEYKSFTLLWAPIRVYMAAFGLPYICIYTHTRKRNVYLVYNFRMRTW